MKLIDLLNRAAGGDVAAASRLADVLRFKARMNYREIVEYVGRHRPELTPERWEHMMQEADFQTSQGMI